MPPLRTFRFQRTALPLWVVAVQFQRYSLLHGHRRWTAPHIERRMSRIEAWLDSRGHLKTAAQRRRPTAVLQEIQAIRRALHTMLLTMKAKDHGADWPTGPDPRAPLTRP